MKNVLYELRSGDESLCHSMFEYKYSMPEYWHAGWCYFYKPREVKMKRCFLWFKHKIVFKEGFGYRCKHCDKPKSQCY